MESMQLGGESGNAVNGKMDVGVGCQSGFGEPSVGQVESRS